MASGIGVASPLVFCCEAENDLFRVVAANRGPQLRYGDLAEAVQQTPPGAALLILAQGYPATPTAIDDKTFRLAREKQLRLYVEYPATLPQMQVGDTKYLKTGDYGAVIERTVVTSQAFGPTLPKMRIMMIHDCHYRAVDVAQSHLLLARVEGYDTAVYDLPAETHPILFEHPQGNLMVATTKLSQFVTGRYAPTSAWPAVWKMILTWLNPAEKDRPDLTWQPTIRPMYSSDATLPTDRERSAIERGVAYYGRSRLYLHPDWPKDTGLDPLDPTWPDGDGTYGIGECYISKHIYADGRQAVSRTLRSDCNLEAAMGLACGAAFLGDDRHAETAQKLGDAIFRHPNFGREGRFDVTSPTYGLVPWDMVTEPSIYYADDNARVILGAIATSAMLKTDRWNEALVRCVLANFRTTGIHGCRPRCITGAQLHEHGWRHYYELNLIDPCAHFQSWIWTTYLWLYAQTGFKPLLDKAIAGIRTMMDAYPKWSCEANRLEQERCRMLLPLAWLVRAKDTSEHRQWLATIASWVIEHQDACGAIGQIPATIVATNENYGTHECAMVHQAGDPATDLLYSINFAFVGMHEAAAVTGNATYAASADRLADFFVRCQTHSDRHAEFDGTWFRGFDFRKWDYWGSDGDQGWGVWTNEIGWTHSWITAMLAMRQMKTSLWDLCRTLSVASCFDANCKTMLSEVL